MKPVFLIPVVALVLAGCDATTSNSRTQNGALVGAAIGGLIGATSTGDNKLERGVIGAAIGGAVGGVIGNELDKQAAELERDLDNEITVVNTGSELRVTMPQDLLFATDSDQDLSERRAFSVASVLRSEGVASARLRTQGAGEAQPVASNGTVAGRAQNRRVEIIIRPNAV